MSLYWVDFQFDITIGSAGIGNSAKLQNHTVRRPRTHTHWMGSTLWGLKHNRSTQDTNRIRKDSIKNNKIQEYPMRFNKI